ncbi:MAG: MerR family transcriptional regulator [Burkholderiaceae bacterium]
MEKDLPPIPAKRYFTIGEVGDLCGVKPHVLRYWEQEFTQLRPMKRRGNRRYYQHHEVLMIRRIRELLYDQGFTISGARNKLQEIVQAERERKTLVGEADQSNGVVKSDANVDEVQVDAAPRVPVAEPGKSLDGSSWRAVRQELMEIRSLLLGQL